MATTDAECYKDDVFEDKLIEDGEEEDGNSCGEKGFGSHVDEEGKMGEVN